MNYRKPILLAVTLTSVMALLTVGCSQHMTNTRQSSSANGQVARPVGWSDETHSDNVDPNYNVVFPQDKVNQIKVTIAQDDWETMQANMTELFGAQGARHQGKQFEDGGMRPDAGGPPDIGGIAPGDLPKAGGIGPRAPGIPGWVNMTQENPTWIPATIEFDGLTWTNVGIRYKGNSSLRSGWSSNTLKMPLKLDFDEFEDEYPEISNQRFYGFKQLSLANSFNDNTYMRDVIAADILAESGLVTAKTAYYEVILDYGEGPVDLGLYIMIEVIDDTVIDSFFGNDSGNIYEGDGPGTSLAEGTFSQIPDSFLKENNRQEADWSDIEALYNTLHSEKRTTDPEAWRESLESIFDVDVFLRWLAISAIIQHWDTYGSMPHNFYLYNNPDTGLLTWISWDHNMVLGVGGGGGRPGGMEAPAGDMVPPGGNMWPPPGDGMRDVEGGMGPPRGGMRGNVSLGREETGQTWPLIRYLLDDPVYYDRYINYMAETVNGAFNPDNLEEKCLKLADLIDPYATKDIDEATFRSAVQALINRINERFEAVTTFLATER